MNRSMKMYVAFVGIVIGYFCYAAWNGITYWGEKPIRNTEYNGNTRGGTGHGVRFYHK